MGRIPVVFVIHVMRDSVEKNANVMTQTVIVNLLIINCFEYQAFYVEVFIRIHTLFFLFLGGSDNSKCIDENNDVCHNRGR